MAKAPRRLIDNLFEGPLDIVGDVHGEHEALMALLERLGHGLRRDAHPEGRRLVFVGDLVDRGPDSPAVIDTVRELCDRGRAQCVLGNHELNLLRGDPKHGNAWFLHPGHEEQAPDGEFGHCRAVDGHRKGDILEFLETLPLALERPDLRVVHAAWNPQAIKVLRSYEAVHTVEVFDHFEALIEMENQAEGLADRALQEEDAWSLSLSDRNAYVPLLPSIAKRDTNLQMGNPLRVLTSGEERPAEKPFFASGKWRMCSRVAWWNEYDDDPRVVFGHYWRRSSANTRSDGGTQPASVFMGTTPADWLGPQRKAYCVDFSVGERYKERRNKATRFETDLLALRLPERSQIVDREY
jgi:hypothetical protein